MLGKLRDAAMSRGMRVISNPRVMKVMADPRVMKVVMQAFQLQGKVAAQVQRKTKAVAKACGLATREEVHALRSTIRSLEGTVGALEQKLERSPTKSSKQL
jgi:hypothetical protein